MSLNVFIYDFTLPSLRVKKFCQVIRVRPAHSLEVLQLSPDVNCRLSIQARKQGNAGGKMRWTYFKTVGHGSKRFGPSQETLRPTWCPKLVTDLRLSYTKFKIIQLTREESVTKSNISRKMFLQVLRVLTLPLLTK